MQILPQIAAKRIIRHGEAAFEQSNGFSNVLLRQLDAHGLGAVELGQIGVGSRVCLQKRQGVVQCVGVHRDVGGIDFAVDGALWDKNQHAPADVIDLIVQKKRAAVVQRKQDFVDVVKVQRALIAVLLGAVLCNISLLDQGDRPLKSLYIALI